MKKLLLNVMANVFAGSVVVGGVALFSGVVLSFYAFSAYTESFFSTSGAPSLEQTAPILSGMINFEFIVAAICLMLCVALYYIAKALKKRR